VAVRAVLSAPVGSVRGANQVRSGQEDRHEQAIRTTGRHRGGGVGESAARGDSRLGISGQLAKTLSSTNPCESMIEIVRYTETVRRTVCEAGATYWGQPGNRSPKCILRAARGAVQVRLRCHLASARMIASQISFVAACSSGKCPRVLIAFRTWRCSSSIVLVVNPWMSASQYSPAFGRLPAVPVVVGSLTLLAMIELTMSVPISIVPGLLVGLTFIAYCVARPSKGWGIFLAGGVPQCGAIILHDITGLAESWLYAALIPVAALCAAVEEQEADEEQRAPHKADGAARPCPSSVGSRTVVSAG